MECNVCYLDKELFLYTKGDYVYSLCQLCLYTQKQIDVFHEWGREQIRIAKDTGEVPF